MELLQLYMLLAVLVPLLLVFLRKKNGSQTRNRPPGPPPLPIIGNLHHLRSSLAPHHHLHHLSQKYGPLMSLKLGSIPALVVSSAKMAKEVMKTHDIAFSGRPAFLSSQKLSYGGFDMVFAPYGQYWRDIRKVCVLHLFSMKMVNSFRPVREDEVQRMLKQISVSKIANLSELCKSLSNNITCRTAFGKRFEHEEVNGKKIQFHRLMQESQALMGVQHLSDYFPFMGWVDRLGGPGRRLDKVFREFDMFYQDRIDERLKAQETRRCSSQQEDILDILLNLKAEGSLVTDQIKAVLQDVLIAGTDTSAATIVWVMTLLMKNQKIMRRVQEEVRHLVKQEKEGEAILLVTEDILEKLAYVKAVVKESLRLQPVAPLLVPHQTIKHCTIDGYEINPGTLVYISAWSIGRDPEAWESPDEFRPERFLGSNSLDYKSGQDFGFIPFGAGRRGCPGMNLGVATVELAVANLLCFFDWDLPEGMKAEDIDTDVLLGITTHKKIPLCLRPLKLQNRLSPSLEADVPIYLLSVLRRRCPTQSTHHHRHTTHFSSLFSVSTATPFLDFKSYSEINF